MEKESFDDEEAAGLLNETFVCIKVDREERPDIDSIYMDVCRAMTGSGGWPLTIIMTADQKPFFAGTYFPKSTRMGRIGVMELSRKVAELWKEKPEEVHQSSEKIFRMMQDSLPGVFSTLPGEKVMNKGYEILAREYDSSNGGFGGSPKFPMPQYLQFLLRYWHRTGNPAPLNMGKKTLESMSRGGVYDHLGGGFHRYATDREWRIPHFEKMLYDQALLSMVYLEYYMATGEKRFAEISQETLSYVWRDLTSSEGGFFSAEDADSEGEEGKFYVWKQSEIDRVLPEKDRKVFNRIFNIKKKGNFMDPLTGRETGDNILYRTEPFHREFKEVLRRSKVSLFKLREKRFRPLKDDKILTDWNGLMIASMALGGRIFPESPWLKAAVDGCEFILSRMKKKDGGLFHRYREGEASINGFLDDYAFFIWGLLELFDSTFNHIYLSEAIRFTGYANDHFWENKKRKYFFTSDEDTELIIRPLDITDGVIPSGNAAMISNLLKLWKLTGNRKYEERAFDLISGFSGLIQRSPTSFIHHLIGIGLREDDSMEIVIVGDPKSNDYKKKLSYLRSLYLPQKVLVSKDVHLEGSPLSGLVPYMKYFKMVDDKTSVYICRNHQCQRPINNLKKLKAYFSESINLSL
jgi:uncharacterized protein YyaL (SSP411 family)